ncbi:unnamed protein product [Dibothriocephalus latus]|uniref:Uncharacterized protein n=1 Tax=Dibothriocephalus latus TaxID=60516 RepID=A0A3P7QY74_DIBLA|nr:unnamed protein product [Dibothriocephalus latus]
MLSGLAKRIAIVLMRKNAADRANEISLVYAIRSVNGMEIQAEFKGGIVPVTEIEIENATGLRVELRRALEVADLGLGRSSGLRMFQRRKGHETLILVHPGPRKKMVTSSQTNPILPLSQKKNRLLHRRQKKKSRNP